MKKLGYPDGCSEWIKPYHCCFEKSTKVLFAKAFRTPGYQNPGCAILVATDTYSMEIDNPDVKLVIQWGLPLSFESMMHRMCCAGRDGGQSTCRTFNSKLVKSQRPRRDRKRLVNEVVSFTRDRVQLSDSNRPKAFTKADDSDTSGMESSLSGSEATDSDLSNDADPMATLLATEAEATLKMRKKARLSRKNHTEKELRYLMTSLTT